MGEAEPAILYRIFYLFIYLLMTKDEKTEFDTYALHVLRDSRCVQIPWLR